MGVICILLGFITFFCFIGVGAILSNPICSMKTLFAMTFTALRNTSDTTITIVVVAFFSFIGLLIGLNMIMNGLTYNKVNKVLSIMRRH